MIRIAIAEDQQMLLSALASLIQLEDDIEVVAQVSDGNKALEAIRALRPDICLLDIEMPGLDGLDVAEAVRRENLDCKIMIVTTFSRPGYLQRATELKVDGYLLKDEPIEFLVEAIRKVHRGERVISPDLAAFLFAKEENPLSGSAAPGGGRKNDGPDCQHPLFDQRNGAQLFVVRDSEAGSPIPPSGREKGDGKRVDLSAVDTAFFPRHCHRSLAASHLGVDGYASFAAVIPKQRPGRPDHGSDREAPVSGTQIRPVFSNPSV